MPVIALGILFNCASLYVIMVKENKQALDQYVAE